MIFIGRSKRKKTATAPKLTSEQQTAVLSLFDRLAYLKIYNSVRALTAGYRGKTEVLKTELERFYTRFAIAEGVEVSFKDAISYMVSAGYITDQPEKRSAGGESLGIAPVYILSKTMFNRYLELIHLTPERERAICESLIMGMDFMSPHIRIDKSGILHALRSGLHKHGYQEPENIAQVLHGLIVGGWLLVNDIPIESNFNVTDHNCSFYPSEKFVNEYEMPIEWGKRYEPKDNRKEMEERYFKGLAKANAKNLESIKMPVPLP